MSRKILIIRFSAIGDCVMAAQAVTAVRRQNPEDQIVWAVDPRCGDVLDRERLVNGLFEVPRERWKRGDGPSSTVHQLKYFSRLRGYGFDFAVDLQGHAKTAVCLRFAGAAKRLAVPARDPAARALLPLPPRLKGIDHQIDIFRKVLEPLGLAPDGAPLMPELDEERAKVRTLIQTARPLATIAVSTGHRKKVYSADRWKAVAERLIHEQFEVAFLGGPGDMAPNVPGALDWVGKLSLKESMAAVTESQVHLAADTGTGHLAAAYGVPLVSVFGWSDSKRYAPRGERVTLLDAGKLMVGLEPASVAEAALDLWRSR